MAKKITFSIITFFRDQRKEYCTLTCAVGNVFKRPLLTATLFLCVEDGWRQWLRRKVQKLHLILDHYNNTTNQKTRFLGGICSMHWFIVLYSNPSNSPINHTWFSPWLTSFSLDLIIKQPELRQFDFLCVLQSNTVLLMWPSTLRFCRWQRKTKMKKRSFTYLLWTSSSSSTI